MIVDISFACYFVLATDWFPGISVITITITIIIIIIIIIILAHQHKASRQKIL